MRPATGVMPLDMPESGLVRFKGRLQPDLKIEQAFELSDASAERSAAGCTVRLNKAPIVE